eukprot:m.39675 g.39675  ORF g.39675 m.39675 type:complete len:346 (+) comp6880_c0_seq2:241-1278(+)
MENPENRTGLLLALISSAFTGASFIIKKKGLIRSRQNGTAASEGGLSYLKEPLWWLGMGTMIVGGVTNFAAYAFAPAILVTPLGALSIITCAILSSMLLEEHLYQMGKIGSVLCVIGSLVIALDAPEEEQISSVSEITRKIGSSPLFIAYVVVVILVVLYLVFMVAPTRGKNNMLVYITICSLIGSVTIISAKGLSIALKLTLEGNNQLGSGGTWLFLSALVPSFLTQMNFLNKALDTFNTALVAPMYYVLFTTATIFASALLFNGWQTEKSDETSICPGHEVEKLLSCVCGFVVICVGVYMLHFSRKEEIRHKEGEDDFVVQTIVDTSGLDHFISSLESDHDLH